MIHKLFLTLLFFIFSSFIVQAQNLGGNPSSLKWQQINGKYSRVIFPSGLDSQANRINNIVAFFDSSTTATIGTTKRKWNIVLLNQTIIPNAYVRLAPVVSEFNMMPGQNNFTTGSLRWDDNLVIHENRHMQQLANFNAGLTKVFSFFLGQDGQLFANGLTIPDYFFEGDAVWQETLVSKQGRGRMPYFFNGFRALAMDHKNYSWMKIRSGSLKDYVPDHYDVGYQIVAYGNEKYGDQFWRKVTTDAVKFKGLFYPFNRAIERYSGISYKQFREDALNYFKARTIPESAAGTELHFITAVKKNEVADYLYPVFINDDTLLVTKQSYKKPGAFYFLIKGAEKKIRVKNEVIDNYFSYRNGNVVYAAYQSDPRWTNRNYSNIYLLNIYTNKQRQLTFKNKYFSPDISIDGSEIIAVHVTSFGANNLQRLDAGTGKILSEIPNPENYFFTQTKYADKNTAISAVRNPEGEMAIVKVNLTTGAIENLTPFSFNVVGDPLVKGDTVYYSAMDNSSASDKIFAVSISTKKNVRLTNNLNGIYQPAADTKGNLIFTAFTADGFRLAKMDATTLNWQPLPASSLIPVREIGAANALNKNGKGILYNLKDTKTPATKYRKSFQLFNFHSLRPYVSDPEYGYTLYSDNVLSTFSNALTYKYNRNDGSHTFEFDGVFAGWFPVISIGANESFNRKVDTAFAKTVSFNSAQANVSISIPLSFVGGRTAKFLNFGTSYNAEQQYYNGIGKNIFGNKAIQYGSSFFSFSNQSRVAIQNINPQWAQSLNVSYRDAFNFKASHKFVGLASFYFPGLFTNHSLVLNAAIQKRDTLSDLFSNNFSYSRGYDALSTRSMYRLGVNYQLPLFYPDWGFGNMVFFQRIRANVFYDHTIATARFTDGSLRDIKNRSVGTEIYFDTKLWNALPATVGIRFSHLMDINYRNPSLKNRWEIVIPFNLIPN